jgi:uncharacterized protein YdeI (YjbR/CyaY-like superfamily)
METAAQWREWLRRHHADAREVWLVTYKKSSGRASLDYETVLDVATCFGWVDGLIRGATPEYYLQRWTPRRPRSNWTDGNRRRARRLALEGAMTPAGYAALPPDLRDELRGRLADAGTGD